MTHLSGFRCGVRAGGTALLSAALLLGAAGCGIRGTSVPVDAGAAPSRASCDPPGEDRSSGSGSAKAVRVQVFLICSAQIWPVNRVVPAERVPDGDRERQSARALLTELQERPTAAEEEAGFTSEVPDGLEITSVGAGDPAGATRLSRRPDELPAYALAQLVCTYAGPDGVGRGHSAVFGGPVGNPLTRYPCDAALRASPEAALSAGTRVP